MLLLSIVATETSTVTFLSLPGQSFREGGSLVFLQVTLGYVVGRLLVVALLLPEFFRGKAFTAYEVLQDRFGPAVRSAASALFLACRTLADGLRLFLTGLALQQALGWDLPTCVVTITVATAVYATLGGVSSVVWNDCLQLTIYTAGAMVAAGLIVTAVPGGVSAIADFGAETGRLRLWDFDLGLFGGSMTFWSGLVGGAILSLATHGVDHLMVQRYLCARSKRSAALALGLSGPLVALQFLMFLLIGVGLAAFFANRPEGADLAADQAFAAFLAGHTPTGLRGLLFAAVVAAAISTLSSSLNASAGVAVKDLVEPLRRASAAGDSSSGGVAAAKGATILFAVLQGAVALGAHYGGFAQNASVVWLVLGIAGFTTGILVGLFFLGMLRGRCSTAAALVALGAGFFAGLLVFGWNTSVDAKIVDGPKVNGMWNALIASGTTLAAGWFASAAMPVVTPPAEASPAESEPAE
ncbi:MAG: transporter [Planctomycetota bacterium]